MSSVAVRPTRRTVVRGAAWSLPVVSVAAVAPAFAASCAVTYTMAWGTGTFIRSNSRNATGTATAPGKPNISLTLLSTSSSTNNVPDSTRNLSLPPTTDGNDETLDPGVTSLGGRAGERGIRLQHSSSTAGRGNRQEVKITFGRAVENLSFYITDIDAITGTSQYSDRVELTSDPVVPVGGVGGRTQVLDGITGTGVNGGAWLRNANLNVGENDPGAQVKVTFPAGVSISSVTLTYWNATGGTQFHRIFIGNMTFQVPGC